MRTANELLSALIYCLFVVLLLLVPMQAQYPGNEPTVVQSGISGLIGAPADTAKLEAEVTSGNLVVVGACVDENVANTYTISDSLGTTFTTLPPITNARNMQMYYGLATSTGYDTVTVGVPGGKGYNIGVAEVSHVSGVLDTSNSNTATSAGTSPQTIAVALTTGTNGSPIISSTCATSDLIPRPPTEYVTSSGNDSFNLSLQRTGLKGSYTSTVANQNAQIIAAPQWSTFLIMQSLAFKPAAIAITTSDLPQADEVSPYVATLTSTGGTASYTYTLVSGSLPTGISVNTATGAFSGTASAAGTFPLVFHVSDGTLTSGNATLNLVVKATPFTTPVISNLVTASITNTLAMGGVSAGDAVLFIGHGFNTHGSSGWLQPSADAGGVSFFSDTLGAAPFKRVCPLLGTDTAPWVAYIGTATSSGTETLNINKSVAGSFLGMMLVDIRNGQGIPDCAGVAEADTQASTFASGPFNLVGSYTTPAVNELIIASTVSNILSGCSVSSFTDTFSVVSANPCTAYDFVALASANAPTTGTYSSTSTITTTVLQAITAAKYMIGIRAGIPTGAPAGAGEKARKIIW